MVIISAENSVGQYKSLTNFGHSKSIVGDEIFAACSVRQFGGVSVPNADGRGRTLEYGVVKRSADSSADCDHVR